MNSSRSSFILIFFVIAVSILYVWPNIGERTIHVHFLPTLSRQEVQASADKLTDYLQRYYKGRYKGKLVEVKSKDSDGIETKESVFDINGHFIQAAFINELHRQPGVDRERIDVEKMWVEKHLKAKPFKLGLDLQGGMNLLMEADFDKLKKQLEEQYPPDYVNQLKKKLETEKNKNEKRKIEAELDQIDRTLNLTSKQKISYIEGAMQIIDSRINKTGVSEPLIRRQGDDKIEISLPGVASPEQAKKIISSTARVEYHLSAPIINGDVQYQSEANAYFSKYLALSTDSQKEAYIPQVERLIHLPRKYGIYVFWGKDPSGKSRHPVARQFLVLESTPAMTGDDIAPNAYAGVDHEKVQNTVNFQLTPQGSKKFAKLTSENIGKFLAITIDNKVRSYPSINSAIVTDKAMISGDFSAQEAKDLAMIIKEGSLPVPMNIVEERSIGPSLGKESIAHGVFAIVLGMIGVAIYMMLYYHLPGMISIFGLALNVLFMSAFFAMIDFTVTLPGLAGVVLTFGMIVDANVIIYERVREELHSGKSLKLALEMAYDRSSMTILDSNFTTIVAAIILMQFGVGPIKGFAVTLCIGILTSVFTSLYVSKSIFSFLATDLKINKLSFGLGKYRKIVEGGEA